MTRLHGNLNDEDVNAATWDAGRGALVGAVKWGAVGLVLGIAGQAMSPVYRNLTVQFKVYLQMSVMVFGASVSGEQRMFGIQQQRRLEWQRKARDRAMWEQYEAEYVEPELPTPSNEKK